MLPQHIYGWAIIAALYASPVMAAPEAREHCLKAHVGYERCHGATSVKRLVSQVATNFLLL